MKKKIVITGIIIYVLLTFKIQINKNRDIYIRIIPIEKIEYIFVPFKLKSLYTKEERSQLCKKLSFSKDYILYLKNNSLYEIIEENGKVVSRLYIPKYEYEITDRFDLRLYGEKYKYADMLYFSIQQDDVELLEGYISVYPNGSFNISENAKQKIIEVMNNNPEA
ncbi:hypothetical protein [Treponema sp.]|uniref:hypothetical protein n=1 Tax=Treponema sp. TaxID=166 RepID=UPI00298E32C9|nr:hypothetical protein [Treponema sp.]MCR5614476.1 hypothetical protein [Treponema sp.]